MPKEPSRTLPPVSSLEYSLRAWEDLWYLVQVRERVRAATHQPLLFGEKPRVVQNHRHFRDFLLNRYSGKRELTIDDFDAPTSKLHQSYWGHLHVVLSGWCGHSRRVYQVQPELQKVLEHTSLQGMTWEDIHLPFKAFAIELSFPLFTPGGAECDMILVNAGADDAYWTFATLRKDLRGYERVDRDHIEKQLKRGKNQRASQLVGSYLPVVEGLEGNFMTLGNQDKGEPILQSLERVTREEWERTGKRVSHAALMEKQVQMLRIAFGLPLYLSSLPVQKNHLEATPRTPDDQVRLRSGLPDPNVISNHAEIFSVSNRFKLGRMERLYMGLEGTKEEQDAVRNSVGREMSCHFHPGYWRRKPFCGNDPNAPRVVEVSPYIVRRDRLPEGSLPGGAQVLLKYIE